MSLLERMNMKMNYQEDAKQLLEELTAPIPVFVRPMVKKGIESKIKDVQTGEEVTQDDVIKGFLMSSPGNMRARAIALLKSKKIDLTPYEEYLK